MENSSISTFEAVVLGLVQGLTEFLPISSTAHLIIAQKLFGRTAEQVKEDPFTIAIQWGTLFAVILYFRKDIIRLAKAFFSDIYDNMILTSKSHDGWLAKYIVIGTIPVVIAGLLFSKILKTHFYNPMSIGIVAIVFALLMLVAEYYSKHLTKKQALRTEQAITLTDTMMIGIFQCLALMPGGSRSGTTISAGLFAGLDRAAAARFSFLLSLPAIFAAGLKDLVDKREALQDEAMLQPLLIGIAVSAIVGYICIAWLINFLKNYSTIWFVGYRILFGLALIAMAKYGWFAK